MNEKLSAPLQEIIEDIREKLVVEFQDCGLFATLDSWKINLIKSNRH